LVLRAFDTRSNPAALPVSQHVTDCCNESPSHGKQSYGRKLVTA
jgi:hypothetical protein